MNKYQISRECIENGLDPSEVIKDVVDEIPPTIRGGQADFFRPEVERIMLKHMPEPGGN